MQTSKLWCLQQVVSRCEVLIERLGLRLQIGSDFEVFNFLALSSEREKPLDPIFRSIDSDIDEVEGIWLIGRNHEDEIVQTQAMRSLRMDYETLEDFMNSRLDELRPTGRQVDLYNTTWRLSEAARTISGQVFYHGGLWIHKDFRGGGIGVPANTISDCKIHS